MKKLTALLLLLTCLSANAQTASQQQNQQQTSTSQASNEGNNQSITFVSTAPAATTSAITQNITSNGTQTVNQNVSGTTTQNVNQNSTISGTQTQNIVYSGTQTVKNVPSVSGQALTSSNDTCMGSASGSANGPGFGVSLGKTYVDEACVRIKASRELWNKGMKAASLALDCMDKDIHDALTMTGYICPQDEIRSVKVSPASNEQYIDPIIRARLGLTAK